LEVLLNRAEIHNHPLLGSASLDLLTFNINPSYPAMTMETATFSLMVGESMRRLKPKFFVNNPLLHAEKG
jgi:hypothetical protein